MAVRIDWNQSMRLAAVITAAVVAVNWIFGNLLSMATQPLFISLQPVSAVTGTVGEKVLGWISGLIPLPDLLGLGIVMTFVSALVAVIIGTWIIDSFNVPVFKGFFGMDAKAGRIASIILWGAVPVYLLLVGTAIPNVGVLAGVLLHAIAVSLVAVWVAGFMNIRI